MGNLEMKHQCKQMEIIASPWDEILQDEDGDWLLSIDGGESYCLIHYCPFCGIRLTKKKQKGD